MHDNGFWRKNFTEKSIYSHPLSYQKWMWIVQIIELNNGIWWVETMLMIKFLLLILASITKRFLRFILKKKQQVVIVGNGGVGKSSMIQRYCKGIYTKDYKKTIGVDFLERQIEYVFFSSKSQLKIFINDELLSMWQCDIWGILLTILTIFMLFAHILLELMEKIFAWCYGTQLVCWKYRRIRFL